MVDLKFLSLASGKIPSHTQYEIIGLFIKICHSNPHCYQVLPCSTGSISLRQVTYYLCMDR